MIYLLDVNALLALSYEGHVHHTRVKHWFSRLPIGPEKVTKFATCSITELGFVRVASGKAALAENVAAAQADLRRLKSEMGVVFLADELDAEQLPEWVSKSSQTTDGHLVALATTHHARLATLDAGIPYAELIPALSMEWTVREPAVYRTAA